MLFLVIKRSFKTSKEQPHKHVFQEINSFLQDLSGLKCRHEKQGIRLIKKIVLSAARLNQRIAPCGAIANHQEAGMMQAEADVLTNPFPN